MREGHDYNLNGIMHFINLFNLLAKEYINLLAYKYFFIFIFYCLIKINEYLINI